MYKAKDLSSVYDAVTLPSYEELKKDKLNYARSFYVQYCNTDPFSGKRLVEPYSDHLYVVQNPPAKPLTTAVRWIDVYALPYMRTYHPSYEDSRWSSGNRRGEIQSDQQPGMFWRLQFLCTDVSSGKNHPDAKS
ncbi:MAG: hypothetical protein ACLTKE_11525 [Coprococcus sp.]